LAAPLSQNYKYLDIGTPAHETGSVHTAGGQIRVAPPKSEEAQHLYSAALLEEKEHSLETLGRIDYEYYIGRLRQFLVEQGVTEKDVKKELSKETKKEKTRDMGHTIKVIEEALSNPREKARSSK
jgi:hypothetical protein